MLRLLTFIAVLLSVPLVHAMDLDNLHPPAVDDSGSIIQFSGIKQSKADFDVLAEYRCECSDDTDCAFGTRCGKTGFCSGVGLCSTDGCVCDDDAMCEEGGVCNIRGYCTNMATHVAASCKDDTKTHHNTVQKNWEGIIDLLYELAQQQDISLESKDQAYANPDQFIGVHRSNALIDESTANQLIIMHKLYVFANKGHLHKLDKDMARQFMDTSKQVLHYVQGRMKGSR